MANISLHLFVTILSFYFLVSFIDLPASGAIRVMHDTRATSQMSEVEIPRETKGMEENELSHYRRMDFEINDYPEPGENRSHDHPGGGGGRNP
ncbi:hypothetical protein OROHE_022989 [Orobanche hederae]